MQPTNRIKLNRSAFRPESNSVPRRQRRRGRSECGPDDPPTPDSAVADCNDALQPPATLQEPSAEGETTQELGYDKGISSSDVWFPGPLTRSRSAVVDERPASRYRLRFALRFDDNGKHVRHDQTGPGTVECYINGKVCVESGPSGQTSECQSAPQHESEPRRRRGRPRTVPRPANETDVKQPQTREDEAPNFSKKTEQRTCFDLVTSSGRCTKRSVKNSFCALCGEIKYTPPTSKKLSCVRKPRLRCPGMPRRQERARVRPAAQPQRKASRIWYRKHPKVKLCDVARVFDMTSRDFLCVMPVVLHEKREHKRGQCFKKEYMSLMRLCPSGNGKWVANQICKVCAPTNSCASLSSGERVSGGTGGEQVSDIVVGHEGCDGTLDNHNARILDYQRMTLTSGVGTTDNGAGGLVVPATGQEDATTPERHVPPLVLQHFPAWNDFGSPKRFLCQMVVDRSTSVVEESEAHHNLLEENGQSDNSEGEVCSLRSFSCQRTQAYVGRPRFSCARTYLSWPFPRRGPPPELKSSVHTGPRWILTITASDVAEQGISSLHMNPECTTGNNVRESPSKSRKSVVAQNGQGQTSATQSKIEPDPVEVGKTPEDPAECQKNPSPASESVHNRAEPWDHSLIGPEPSAVKESVIFPECRAPCCLENGSSKAGDTCSPKATCDESKILDFLFDKQHNSPTKRNDKLSLSLVSVAGIKTTELRSPSDVQTQNLSLGLEGSEKSAVLTTSQDPCQDMGLMQRTLKTSPVMRHPGEETHSTTPLSSSASSEILCPKVDHQATASMIVHHRDEQSSNTVFNRTVFLCPKTTDPASAPPTSTKGRRWKKHFNSLASKDNLSSTSSSTGEDISSLSSNDDSEEPDAECPLLQEDVCEIRKADQGSPPFRSTECSVVAGTDLDVLRAYEEDAIVLDVIQDDPDLFGAIIMETPGSQTQKPSTIVEKGKQVCLLPEKSGLRNHNKIVWDLESKSSRPALLTSDPVQGYGPEDLCTVETSGKTQGTMNQLISSRRLFPLNPIAKPEQTVTVYDYNMDKRCIDVNVDNMSSSGSSRLVIDARSSGCAITRISSSVPRSLTSSYCWYYFSEHYTCQRTMCWYLHLPRNDDEKFCMEMVQKFCRAGNPLIVQRAVEVFVGYYATNAPGASFSPYVVNSLVSSLLSLALLNDLLSVINTLLIHKKMPPPEFVVSLYEHVRERGLLTSVSELVLLTSKIIEAGCVFTVSQCELMQSQLQMLQVPIQQMSIFHTVKCRALATNPHTAEVSVLAEAEVRVEICKQQENWPGLASVFCSVCAGRCSTEEISKFCCCVTVALLKKSKDILTLPYEPFAESVCQEVPSDELIKSFLGRVGISLLFKYRGIQEWAKGVRLVKTMSRLHVEFSKLKGLFASEDGMSRCQLITVAAEIFLNSGSIEGALNVFREHEWFVSSNTWPCEPADVENRRRVLALLAGKTSHRDTLEVLSNLPGLRQPLDGVQVGEYSSVFNAHLQKCITNQVLPVAADTLEFMLTQGIAADTSFLQTIIQKLGKQNIWNRARALFKCARSGGYYTDVLCEKDSLAVPCSLKEIELILAVEMFITCLGTSLHNPADPSLPLLITLKRDCGGEAAEESVYLAASCRMLSVSQIPNPRLSVRYIAVNQNREQFFHLDRRSAARWLSHNHMWAQEMWAS